MAKAKGTAENAKIIEEQMTIARNAIAEALKAVRTAREAVQSGEREADIKVQEFANLGGLLSIAFATANRTSNDWSDYADAREKR